jgi:hypothetical protein
VGQYFHYCKKIVYQTSAVSHRTSPGIKFTKGPFGSIDLNPISRTTFSGIELDGIESNGFQFSCLAIDRIDFLKLNSKCCLNTFI